MTHLAHPLLFNSLKASLLAAAIVSASATVQAETTSLPWVSSKDSIVSAVTETLTPRKVRIFNNDEYPIYQNLEFARYWIKHASKNMMPGDLTSWAPDKWSRYQFNQSQIHQTIENTQFLLSQQGRNLDAEREKAKARRNALQEQYDQCAISDNSWADLTAGALGLLGVIHVILGHPIAAVGMIGLSCGTYYISGMMKHVDMTRLKKALVQNDIDFEVLAAQESSPEKLLKANTDLQEARALILQNIALLNDGDLLTDKSRIQAVTDLFKNSSFRRMQLPLKVNSHFLEGELYGSLASQSDDDIFVVSIDDGSSQIDANNTFKLLRSNNQYYVAVTIRGKAEFLEFPSAKDVLTFLRSVADTYKAKQVDFIHLDPALAVSQ